MTMQIAVRLPEELVAFLDTHDESRATVIRRALEREQRHERTMRDIAILDADPDDDDMDSLAAWAAKIPRPHLD